MLTHTEIVRPSRPEPPQVQNIPEELKSLRRWLCWRYSVKPNRNGKYGKVPHSIVDRKADYTNPNEWLPFEAALLQYRRGLYDGIGIVLGEGLVGLDEDHCITEDGFAPEARRNLGLLRTYTEESVSGDGCHALAKGSLPSGPRKLGNHEIYCEKRFFVVTGKHIPWTPRSIQCRDHELRELYNLVFTVTPQDRQIDRKPIRIPTCRGKAPEMVVSLDNQCQSGTVEPFDVTQLGAYSREEEERKRKKEKGGKGPRGRSGAGRDNRQLEYPDGKIIGLILNDRIGKRYWRGYPKGVNPSAADCAIAMKLAFYTGRNIDQMDRLFRTSGLYGRSKHQTRRGDADYVRYTLEHACKQQAVTWVPTVRQTGSKLRVGRPLSELTEKVLRLKAEIPSLSAADIARQLSLQGSDQVRVILRQSARRGSYL